jgi:hypothetical protein
MSRITRTVALVVAFFIATLGGLALAGSASAATDQQMISYCHATPADTAKEGYVLLTTSVDAFFTSGHPEHTADIVPAFTYTKGDQTIKYPGQNTDAFSQATLANDCVPPTKVTPAAPTFTDACGTANDTVTIPATTGVTYKINGVVKAAGTYPATGTVTVTAVAKDKTFFVIGTAVFTKTFTNVACQTPPPPPPPPAGPGPGPGLPKSGPPHTGGIGDVNPLNGLIALGFLAAGVGVAMRFRRATGASQS